MRFSRTMAVPSMLAAAGLAASVGVASADDSFYEQHRFSGSSTSAEAFQKWFDGEEFVEPSVETRDLTELKVNEFETAEAGDVIYKDDQGRFWIIQEAVIK
ncbi:hypothetical protein [Corynebacterium lowii]|uniref:Uncharacterized protein n=1 Tax=Corynebacterium lowii TaxID=1544413 RepID=A0A0Q0UJE5_9CORY|nr:hypothetical protein [Corynebacterium lowii]KQB86340.1 hypothetical protein Clow_01259 [Corynebacterium lowii]MDP9850825.1 uridine phosphorylase [Corynebacterium lowii]